MAVFIDQADASAGSSVGICYIKHDVILIAHVEIKNLLTFADDRA